MAGRDAFGRLGLYRTFQRGCVERWILPRFFSPERRRDGERVPASFQTLAPAAEAPRIWFHAASYGELEALWTVITDSLERKIEAVVTVFSESARERLRQLAAETAGLPGKLVFAGYSPWEGRWAEALRAARPRAFVTAKYEAWPELWSGLGELGIPLVIVGARPRRSLRVAKSVCAVLGSRLPSMLLLTAVPEDQAGLSEIFPDARILNTGDPRWDRVSRRAGKGNARAKELIAAYAGLPRPWGVLGSAWESDLEVWKDELASAPGTLWVVPHEVNPETIGRMEEILGAAGLAPRRSSQAGAAPASFPAGGALRGANPGLASPDDRRACVLVDEMGFLSELYAAADWAFVGGGFGKGVHSTIEPAIHGIPVGIGPAGADRFPEIGELRKSGQLAIVRDRPELHSWLGKLGSVETASRSLWAGQARERIGTTQRILSLLPLEL